MRAICSLDTACRAGFSKWAAAAAVAVAAGALVAAEMPSSGALAHRWSFAGDAKDSVTGAEAKKTGGPRLTEKALVLPGGRHGAGHLDLGTNLLPADGSDVTIEVWATLRSNREWARIFDYGSDDKNYFTMAWSRFSEPGTDSIEMCHNGVKSSAFCRLCPYRPGVPCHISVTLRDNRNGSTTMRAMRRNAATGAIEREHSQVYAGWTLASLSNPRFLLGGSQYAVDDDAGAEYDEVRVWKCALSDAQLAANAKAGPDALPARVEVASGSALKPIPAFIFGQNIEHTRSALQGGLSAQLVRNRKFAGKPGRDGVAMMWKAYGAKAFYHHAEGRSFTRHAARSAMPRRNERASQVVGCLDAGGEAGVCQGEIGLRGGVAHNFRAVVSTMHPEDTPVVLRVKAAGRVLAEKTFTVNTRSLAHWTRVAFDFTPPEDATAEIQVGVKGRRYISVGAVSVMPADNFRGMRADVIENLREIGTSIVRWPGGNFAGEYRWRDGLIADPDERAPLQACTEIESQPHGLGYDQNDIGMEDIIALCERIGAQPFFTLNAAWEKPKDSADWVKACRGRVKMWSLGNEMGYAHMEGSFKGAKGYTAMVRPHAEAMLKVDPSLQITASGPYPGGGYDWIENSAKALNDMVPTISYHRYDVWDGCLFDYSTPESTAKLFDTVSKHAGQAASALTAFRARLPWDVGISYDEWNIWYMWYRREAIVEGLYAAKMLGQMMRNWEAWGLRYVCYFQPINEQAITVSPFESHLTSIGEAMRLWKGHVGGTPAPVADMPENAFATDAPDGTRYITFFNFSTVRPCTFRIPADGRGRIVAEETLVPDGLETGCRYARKAGLGRIAGGFYELTLGPACQAAVRIAR